MAHQGYYTNPSNLENVNDALAEVEASKTAAETAATNASLSADQADLSETQAAAYASNALASANSASNSEIAASNHSQNAQNSAAAAAADAILASQYADNSQTYSIQSSGYRDEALGFRNEAELFKNQAEAATVDKITGPASAVDNEIVRFSGTTGKESKAGLKYQTNLVDVTAGALLVNKAFGLGSQTLSTDVLIPDINSTTTPSGTYAFSAAASGTLPVAATPGTLEVHMYAANAVRQIAYIQSSSGSEKRFFTRNNYSGTWSAWDEVFTTGNQLALGTTAASGRTALGLGTVATQNYATGTFTPVIAGTTTAGTGTYTSQVGSYTKVGDRVYFELNVAWTAHTGTGNIQLTGLPFSNTAGCNTPVSILHNNLVVGTGKVLAGVVALGTSNITFSAMDPAGTANVAIAMDTAASLNIAGVYKN